MLHINAESANEILSAIKEAQDKEVAKLFVWSFFLYKHIRPEFSSEPTTHVLSVTPIETEEDSLVEWQKWKEFAVEINRKYDLHLLTPEEEQEIE